MHKSFFRSIIFFIFLLSLFTNQIYSQQKDTVKKYSRVPSLGGIFLSVGTGLNAPLQEFSNNSGVTPGLLGRLEYSTISIFPLVIGAEVTYFSHGGTDEFKTQNQLTNFTTKIFSVGLTAEYALSKLFNISYTTPFLTADIKYNTISRNIEPADIHFENLPVSENKISFAAGAGFTLFVLDIALKYVYMKNISTFTVLTKVKFPLMRF